MDFSGINKTFDLDHLCALEFDFLEILRGDDDVLLRFELVALDDFIGAEGFASFLAFLFITDRPVVLLVELVEPNGFFGINGAVYTDRYGDEGESNVTFPDGSHSFTFRWLRR